MTRASAARANWTDRDRIDFKPPEQITVSEWADRNRILVSLTSSEPGPWSTARAPYLRGIMDSFCDPEVESIILCKGTQLGGTESLYNMLGYALDQEPASALFVMPTIDLAKYAARNRIQMMIENCASLLARLSPDPNDYTLLEMVFSGAVLSLAGANSAASLASRPVRYLFLDEVDKYKPVTGKEGDPIKLAWERTKTYWNRKVAQISTPTFETGNIWSALSKANLILQYFTPCPHCGHFQTLKFDQIKWPKEERDPDIVGDLAWYECEECAGVIGDTQKGQMLARGEWRQVVQKGIKFFPMDEKKVRRIGRRKEIAFHINSLYSPFLSWGDVAAEFLKSKDVPETFQNFINSWLAEPWIEKLTEKDASHVFKLKADYEEGAVYPGAILLTAGADRQKDYLEYVVRAWARDGESWLVKHGQVESLEDLETLVLNARFQVMGKDKTMAVALLCIDSGYQTDEIYEFARKHPRRVRAIKGASHQIKAPYMHSRIDYFNNGKAIPGGLLLWLIDTGYWKDFIARRMQIEDGKPAKWHVHQGVTMLYAEQVTAERKISVRKGQKKQEVWKPKRDHYKTEAWDAEVYAAAAADMAGLKYLAAAGSQEKAAKPTPKAEGTAVERDSRKNVREFDRPGWLER